MWYIVNKTNEGTADECTKACDVQSRADYFLLDEQKQQLSALLKKRQLQPDSPLTPQQRVSFLICYMIYPKAVIHVEDIMRVVKMQPQCRVQ